MSYQDEKLLIPFNVFCECCIYNGVDMTTREHLCSNLESKTNMTNPNDCPRWQELKKQESEDAVH